MKKFNKFILASTPILTIAGMSVISASCSPKKVYKYAKEKWKNRKKNNPQTQPTPTPTTTPTTTSQPNNTAK
ncbi:hypothetical protein [Mycoplasmopsis bovigenitalium]|uniref:hypothetical protein n=1 Tax=Mycoplasmopsis bovigenitalium TaxID=2112 RepID=UPI000BBB5B6B|nr:hypothetical protein [Mycoplasmopsis bovigenitalium]